MVNKSIRKALEEYGKDNDLTLVFLDNQAYDNSIVGITSSGRVVYDYAKMIEELAIELAEEDHNEADADYYIQAQEWIDYNTMRSIPYMGEDAPIVIECSREELLDKYGE